MNFRSGRGHGRVVALISGALLAQAQALPDADGSAALAAVRAWYRTIGDGSNQADLAAFGTVGGGPQPLANAYRALAPSLQSKLTETQFFQRFHGLAHLKLLQAHVARPVDGRTREIFVEEERTLAIDGIPAVAWYDGFLRVIADRPGWKISALDGVRPEDIISLQFGGHMPWRSDAAEVAQVEAQCAREGVRCEEGAPHSPAELPGEEANLPQDSATVVLSGAAKWYAFIWRGFIMAPGSFWTGVELGVLCARLPLLHT